MTRKNVSAGLLEQFSHKCEHCSGRGVVIDESFNSRGSQMDSVSEVEAS
jgi:ribonuclease E